MPVTMDMQRFFFDRQQITTRVGRAKAEALRKQGGLVRKISRRSLRRRQRSAAPGQPPSHHTNPGLKLILFFYDAQSETTVVGPVLFPTARRSGPTVPELHEKGGSVSRRDPDTGRSAQALYPQRAFMQPAGAEAAPQFARQFAHIL